MHVPQLSAYHTLENSQGTLDPLGMYSLSDKLALKLTPGLRERMRHPRYLTAIAVSSLVCETFEKDVVAADGVSAPWQVFEWHVVSGLVKRFHNTERKDELIGMPGRDKATMAMKNDLPLSAKLYLKTPTVFGFHGVYRTLAKDMGLLKDDQPGELAFQLVHVWEKEQGLDGFVHGNNGAGRMRTQWMSAVEQGLEGGKVMKPWSWDPFKKIAEVLAPKSTGQEELNLIMQSLQQEQAGQRDQLIQYLLTGEGRSKTKTGSEKQWHEFLLTKPMKNKALIKGIIAYERFCRLLYNAFYEILLIMKNNHNKGTLKNFAQLLLVEEATKSISTAFIEAELALASCSKEEAMLFATAFDWCAKQQNAEEFIHSLLAHHNKVQKNKQPASKAPWLQEVSAGKFMLVTAQELDVDLYKYREEYVHQYRLSTLRSFLKDFGKI